MAHILIIDDSPTDVHMFSAWLAKAGYTVSVAGDVNEGLASIRRERPDAIIMDVIMPGTNGFQATRQLSRDSATSDIPIIIVTTKSMETDRVWGLRQGAKDFLSKPVGEKELLARIANLLPS